MQKIDIINNPEFRKAVNICVNASIDACNSCGATYDEFYLENKWERRLLDVFGKNRNTSGSLVNYAEENFTF